MKRILRFKRRVCQLFLRRYHVLFILCLAGVYIVLDNTRTVQTETTHIFQQHHLQNPSFEIQMPNNSAIVYKEDMPKLVERSVNSGPLKRVKGIDIFLYSAVLGNSSVNASWDQIVLTGWQHKDIYNKTLKCCIRYSETGVETVSVSRVIKWAFFGKATREAKQYVCPNARTPNGNEPISVTVTDAKCHMKFNWYMDVSRSWRQSQNSVAVCAKLAYGNLNASDIVEWFEIHKKMGVDKVIVYTYRLNIDAAKVLNYYNITGMAEVYPFRLPPAPKGLRQVAVGVKNYQAWNDEQVTLYDCVERLKGYTYVAVVDLDEYIIPTQGQTWKQMLNTLSKRHPRAAGYAFKVHLHITSWGVSNPGGQLKVTRYLNRTKPMMDRVKNIFLPDRVNVGGVSTHVFFPQIKYGYKRIWTNTKDVTLKHYRSCRKQWLGENTRSCYAMERIADYTMIKVTEPLLNKILDVKKKVLS